MHISSSSDIHMDSQLEADSQQSMLTEEASQKDGGGGGGGSGQDSQQQEMQIGSQEKSQAEPSKHKEGETQEGQEPPQKDPSSEGQPQSKDAVDKSREKKEEEEEEEEDGGSPPKFPTTLEEFGYVFNDSKY